MISKIIYMFTKNQARGNIPILWVSTHLLKPMALPASPPALSPPFYFLFFFPMALHV